MSANVVLLPLIKFELNEIDGFKHKSQFYYKRGFANTVVGPLYAFFFLVCGKIFTASEWRFLHIGCIHMLKSVITAICLHSLGDQTKYKFECVKMYSRARNATVQRRNKYLIYCFYY